jgi:hypothetical protein
MTPTVATPLHYIEVPTFENGIWSYSMFKTREDFRDFVIPLFKEPGQYEFDETSFEFVAESRKFNATGVYLHNTPKGSKDYKKYWDAEKEKCRRGAIYKNNGKTWYLTRDYYMWLNFLPIFDKEEKKFGFAKVRDAQYHIALYEILAELHYEHSAILKKRQIASSYFHMAKLINQYWFEEGAILKMGASLKDYINEKGSWKFLDEYKNFLNEHTAWYRHNEPDKVGAWQQKIKVTINGRDTYKGLKSMIQTMSFEKDATNGVGGPCTLFFHEEGGIAPKMDETYGYIEPAMRSGMLTTGMFITAGSVGDLSQCGPLKEYILHPKENGFRAVASNLIDSKGTIGETGLFIPEQWSMPPFIDEFGNSLVKEALEALEKEFADLKKKLTPAAYQLKVSQRPRNIEEAFAFREESKFPQEKVSAQMRRIADGEYPYELLDIVEDHDGKPMFKSTNKIPIREFPISKKTEDKEGAIMIWERPIKDAPWGTYYASVDPVGEGKTTTSESLCSIVVYKNSVERVRDEGNGNITRFIEQGRVVASWCGRYDDLKKTHKRLEMIIRMYNAWTVVENNIALFIQYMIERRQQKYLVPKDQMLFLKELNSNTNVYADYGWKNTGNLFKTHLLSYLIEYVKEELEVQTDEDGTITKIHFGIERIPDPMIMTEMQAYVEGLNVDRLVSLAALIAFVQVQQANRGITKVVETTTYTTKQTADLYKWTPNGFVNMGRGTIKVPNSNVKVSHSGGTNFKLARTGFKNFR